MGWRLFAAESLKGGADGKISRKGRGIIRGVRVYVEVVFINNLVSDALLMYATLLLRRKKVGKLRLTVAALIGAAVGTAYPLLPEWAQILVRLALAPLMTLLFAGSHGIKDYITSLAVFCALTFALGGVVTGVNYLLGADIRGYLILGILSGAALALLICIKMLVRTRALAKRRVCTAKITVGGKEIAADALCDTGNALTDTVSGLPVMIVSERLAASVDGWHGREKAGNIQGFVELTTVSGTTSLPIVKVDDVRVGDRRCAAYAALAERNFDGYEVILQNTMF